MSKQRAVARKLVAAGRKLWPFQIDGVWHLRRATDDAMKEAEAAFSLDDYDRAAHLAAVVERMAERDLRCMQADRAGWIAKHGLPA